MTTILRKLMNEWNSAQ